MLGPVNEEIPDEMDVLRALAHPVRWGILQRLAAEPGICACDFTEFFEVSQPTISVHLKVLREARLVRVCVDAQKRLYQLDPAGLAEIDRWLARVRRFWTGRLDNLERELRKRK